MTFKQWFRLQEVGTGSNCVATFSLPLQFGSSPNWSSSPEDSVWKSPEEQKKKHKKKDKK